MKGQRVGRYALYDELASGGMATVHLGRLHGEVGFSRIVAVKRLQPQFLRNPEFCAMLVDEARLVSRISHPNVVPTLDVVHTGEELLLVMEYVRGESLARLKRLAREGGGLDPSIVVAIMLGALQGLHAAHEATDERGAPLRIVHRDVSPQNIMVGADGVARLLDFGVAKAAGRVHETRDGVVKGKIAYMAPEQVECHDVDRRVDIYSAAVVLWEALTSSRLFTGPSEAGILARVLDGRVAPPSSVDPKLAPFDDVVMRGLACDRSNRYTSAREMALDLAKCGPAANQLAVAELVSTLARESLRARSERVAVLESLGEGEAPLSVGALRPTTISSSELEPAEERTELDALPSSISVRRANVHPTLRKRALAATAFSLLLLLSIASFMMLGRDRARASAERSTPTASEPEPFPPTPSRAEEPPPSGALAAPVEPPSALEAPPPPASAAPSSSAAAAARPRKVPSVAPTSSNVNARCYRRDPSGIVHVKPECL